MTDYNHKTIDKKWQKRWDKDSVFEAQDNSKKKKKYILDMFPYPSGDGLHVGHPLSYVATDIYSRYLRMNNYCVLHPIGWDAFGLPAENYAIKKGVHPSESIKINIANFRRQIKSLGLSYDWTREVNTSNPEYYKWTQWIFLQLYKAGLAYKKKAPVNWCRDCKTVLANEQVVNGKCERCGNEVVQKYLEQWFFKITGSDPSKDTLEADTKYPERLLSNLDNLDWPEPIKHMQRNWIGKSEGAMLSFGVSNSLHKIEVFTTRPDTLYGATYMVLSPEHELVKSLKHEIKNWQSIEQYIKQASSKSQLERTDLAKEKSGVELKGVSVINPANGEEIPVWIADYVLTGYGTGAIMAVPSHDQRDFEFAKKFGLKIKKVVDSGEKAPSFAPGKMINSEEFNEQDSEQAKWKITEKVKGKKTTQYKLRDWLISRQRYWGAPIPIIYCDNCGEQPVPEKDLPVELPTDVDFNPKGDSPLALSKSFHTVKCPECKQSAKRESDTMDTFVDSSWYFLRYTDSKNKKEFASKKNLKTWLPVDTYVGGAEHAVLHLMYARFFCMALFDLRHIDFQEPFTKLRNQGFILGPDNQKMSKSKGNVINPDEVIANLGADCLRMYEMFMGPLEDTKPWDTNGIIGVRRFLERVMGMQDLAEPKFSSTDEESQIGHELAKTIKKTEEDIQKFSFNTAVSQFMIFVNMVYKVGTISTKYLEDFLIILNPFAPHITNELWSKLGNKTLLELETWPKVDVLMLTQDKVNYVVQVNGKLKANISLDSSSSEDEVAEMAQNNESVAKYIKDKKIVKQIFVEGRLINFVVA